VIAITPELAAVNVASCPAPASLTSNVREISTRSGLSSVTLSALVNPPTASTISNARCFANRAVEDASSGTVSVNGEGAPGNGTRGDARILAVR
jgi:hypothetical protein